MRLKTNFIYGVERFRILSFYVFWGLIAACLFLAIYFVLSGSYMRSDMALREKKLAAVKAEFLSMPKAVNGPGQQALLTLQSKVAAINRLKMGKSYGVTKILAALEKITMEGVYFTGFTYNLEDNSVQIEARTDNAVRISGFMEALEKQGMFRQVTLDKQSQRESASGLKAVDFTVKAVENLP
jgi:Tfp pilus assembly protein PilN